MTPEQPISAWLKPRSRWLVWPVLLLGFAAAFGAGAALAPERVEVRTELVEVVRKVKVKSRATERVVYIEKTTSPDGTVLERRSEREVAKVETSTKTDTAQRTSTETTPRLPSWRVGLQAGATWKEPALQLAGPLVIGVSVEARLAKSPVSVGAWGSTYGAAGASVSVEF